MPEIIAIPPNITIPGSRTVQVQLSKEGLVLDTRAIPFEGNGDDFSEFDYKFECSIEGTTLTVTKIEGPYDDELEDSEMVGWWDVDMYFRVYDPEIEEVPDFTDESYMYHGLEHERPPRYVKEVIVHPSVTIIPEEVFKFCELMKRCIMGDSVKRIEDQAFPYICTLESIRLSRSLEYIGLATFYKNHIKCLFIPPSVKNIQCYNFELLSSNGNKILVLPPSYNLLWQDEIICTYYPKGPIQESSYNYSPLIRLCADPDISAPMIRDFMQANGTAPFLQMDANYGLTPLHILSRYNAFASKDAIVTCYLANPSALVTPDAEGNTPLTYLWWEKEDKYANDDMVDMIVQLVQDLCIHRRQSQEMNFKR